MELRLREKEAQAVLKIKFFFSKEAQSDRGRLISSRVKTSPDSVEECVFNLFVILFKY